DPVNSTDPTGLFCPPGGCNRVWWEVWVWPNFHIPMDAVIRELLERADDEREARKKREFNKKMKDATKKAFKELGSGCKKHFDVEDANKMAALNQWIDQNLEFVDVSDTGPEVTAIGLNPDNELVKRLFPDIRKPTVLIGGAFKNPSRAPDRLPQEDNAAYQR